jgi:hypothetical protein
MARRGDSFGFWDFLSGRAAAAPFEALPKIQVGIERGPIRAKVNPTEPENLLLLAGLLAAGYAICKITSGR